MNDSGFGDVSNTAATLFKIWGNLYAVTDNVNGVQAYSYDSQNHIWEEETGWNFLSDHNNIAVSAKLKIRGNSVFLAFTNTVTGTEVWQLENIGSQGDVIRTTQVNYDGFGNSGYTSVLHMLKFNNRVLAYVQNAGDGNVRVLRTPMDTSEAPWFQSWEFITDLDHAEFSGLDGAEIFNDSIFLANHEGASVWKSDDGRTYNEVTSIPGTVTDLQHIDDRNKLYATNIGGHMYSSGDGLSWTTMSNIPYADRFYQLLPKNGADRLALLGQTVDKGSLFVRNGSTWTTKTVDGFGNSDNTTFSSALWFQKKLWVASRNTTDGTEIFKQL